MSATAQGLVRIGPFSRRVGVSISVLRAWETRYGLFTPTRTPGGFRLYSSADEARARRMLAHLSEGLAARESASLAMSGGVSVGTLVDAWAAFDASGAHASLDVLLSRPDPARVISEEVLPALAASGEAWLREVSGPARLHFAARMLETRLLALGERWHEGSGPLALLGCGPGEQHTLGLVTLALALHARGWRIAYLGANTPTAAFTAAAGALRPTRVVVSYTVRTSAVTALMDLRSIPGLAVTGPGVPSGLAAATRVHLIEGDPLTAADALQV